MRGKELLRRVQEEETGVEEERIEQGKGHFISILIGAMIALVVGISLLPEILKAAKEAEEEAPEGLGGLIEVLPYVFVAIVILGAVAFIGFGRREKYEEVEVLSGEDEIRALQRKKRKHIIYGQV